MKSILVVTAFTFLSAFTVINLKPADNEGAVTFTIKNFGINTKGSFRGLQGSINWDAANPSASSFNVSADAKTINTSIDARDKELKEEAYFNADKYPVITFTSTQITGSNGNYHVTGNLSMKGITKTISFPFTVTSSGGGYLFKGEFTINRLDYNIGGNSMVLSDNVDVNLNVQANP
jgi:polyisoprenoid-binding protein YceI